MTSVLRFDRRGRIALLVLDRPSRLNAIGSDTVAELHQHLDVIEADSELRAIVITGEGRAFSAGADISELDTLHDGADFGRFVKGLTDAYDRLEASPVPSIAAINGMAFGGGCELALACDLRLAAPGARLGVPEIKLGLLPAAGGSQRLTRMLPAAVATHMLMTGAPLDAATAVQFGLVNSLHDDVVAAALELAEVLAAGPPAALAAAKKLVHVGTELPLAMGIELERSTVSALFDTADRVEGLTAFREKRSPKFNGR
ncbi:MAG: enoyl-CoA hydratase/isomerase family protein [Actinomycetota bacterium]|nr:enoyl-CoA hydratase/isomerase family protein [Actinomycetota bacterium]